MSGDGPYISVAALCEAVLHEKDDRVSCIRFLDRMEVGIPADAPDPITVLLQVNCLLSFKSGGFVGTKTVTVKLKHPRGDIARPPDPTKPTQEFQATFNGGEHGNSLILQLQAAIDQSGLFMFDVLLDGEVVTRIPLRVIITRVPQPQIEPESSQKA